MLLLLESQPIPSTNPEMFVVLTDVMSDYTCAGNFQSTLHMVYVIFEHSHFYFKSLHLVSHFFCLAHSAVRILVSTSYKCQAACRLKKKKNPAQREQVGLLYKLNSSEAQNIGLQAHRTWRFLLWHGCLNQGQQERVKLLCMSGGCVGNCSHFMRNLYPQWYYKQFFSHFLFLCSTHPHTGPIVLLQKKKI